MTSPEPPGSPAPPPTEPRTDANGLRLQMRREDMLQRLKEAAAGEYEILEELGRGGMATVYLAHDLALDRRVAIKVMSPHLYYLGPELIERFKREARTAGRLSHPHIISIHTVKETEHALFFVMKYVEGRSLESIISEYGRLPIKMVQTILTQVGGALGYAHRRGVIHRDIKPANLMIDNEGYAVVTDFGVAKARDLLGLSTSGLRIGTPRYMSPEQCAGAEVDAATDQYSLGVTAYEMLTGEVPFPGKSMDQIMAGHMFGTPEPVERGRPDCPPQLAAAVMRMLEKNPSARSTDLGAIADSLGTSPLQSDDPVRAQMMELGRSGEKLRRLSRSAERQPAGWTQDESIPLPAPRPIPLISWAIFLLLLAILVVLLVRF